MVEPVRPTALQDIEDARGRIAGTALRTPLVRLDLGPAGPDIRLKLENLQPINAYKIRGALNAVARLGPEERSRGVWTISAGNAGQAVAFAARAASIPCSVVAVETAPQTKLDRMRALGATVVPVSYEDAWNAAEAGWVRAGLAHDRGVTLRADLDRLMLRGIVPDRARALAQPPEALRQDWERFKERWAR